MRTLKLFPLFFLVTVFSFAQNTGIYPLAIASGTDTYSATVTPAFSAYVAGQRFNIKFTNANTGAATININSKGAVALKKSGSTALAAGDIATDQILFIQYDGTNMQVVGGGGGAITASNGLTKTGNNITLGGTISSGNADIATGFGTHFRLRTSGVNGFDYAGSTTVIGYLAGTNITYSSGTALIGGAVEHLTYTNNKSSIYSDRSVPDWGNVWKGFGTTNLTGGTIVNTGVYGFNFFAPDDVFANGDTYLYLNQNTGFNARNYVQGSATQYSGFQITNGVATFQDTKSVKTGIRNAAAGYETDDLSLITRGFANSNFWKTTGVTATVGNTEIDGDFSNDLTFTFFRDLFFDAINDVSITGNNINISGAGFSLNANVLLPISYEIGVTPVNAGELTDKEYVDAKIAATITNGVTTSAPSQDAVFDALVLKANLASPTFTGTPAAPTAAASTNSTQIATTAFVKASSPKTFIIPISDETTALTAGTGKVTFRMPYAMTLTGVRGSLTTTQTSGSIFTVNIKETGSTILSTKITIDNTEKTSTTAVAAPVISDTTLADDAEITIDIDQIGDGTGKGCKITFIGY